MLLFLCFVARVCDHRCLLQAPTFLLQIATQRPRIMTNVCMVQREVTSLNRSETFITFLGFQVVMVSRVGMQSACA